MADIFEQFETKPRLVKNAGGGVGNGEGEGGGDPRAYAAYRPVDRQQVRLAVRPVGDVWDRLPYRMLLRIMEQGREGTGITLVYSFMAVFIEGRNLAAVADAIENERCEFIEEFNALRYDKPGDEAAPFIAKITLHAAAEMGEPGKMQPGRKKREDA